MTPATLLRYSLHPDVQAFSTTRLSPFPLSAQEVEAMGRYAAFNVTHYCGDDPERVARCRAWLASEIGINETRLWVPRQTHTTNVLAIDDAFLAAAPEAQVARLQDIDALLTNISGQCIGVSTADCIPVLLYDPAHHAAAAVHAGWRGTLGRIAVRAVKAMQAHYGSRPSDLLALLGPGITAPHYEVGIDLAQQFLEAGFPQSIVTRTGTAKPHLDLFAANAWQLEEAGLALAHIQVSGLCTYAHSDSLFSARKLGTASGRIYTAICLAQRASTPTHP